MAEARALMSGMAVIAGVRYDSHGPPLHEQITALSDLSGSDLAAKLQQVGNFLLVLMPGHVGVIPAGVLVATLWTNTSSGLKWGLSTCNRQGEDEQVLQMVSALLATYPALNGTAYVARQKRLQGGMASAV